MFLYWEVSSQTICCVSLLGGVLSHCVLCFSLVQGNAHLVRVSLNVWWLVAVGLDV